MKKHAWFDGHTENFDRDVRPDNAEMRVAGYSAAGEVMEIEFANRRKIAHGAICDEADSTDSRKDGGHHFAAVRRALAIAADFLQHHDGGFRSVLDGIEQFNERGFFSGRAGGDGF